MVVLRQVNIDLHNKKNKMNPPSEKIYDLTRKSIMRYFGPIWAASGALGFFGERYWFHDFLKLIPGYTYDDVTLVTKTTTLNANVGNMKMRNDGITPSDYFPDCVVVKHSKNVSLNSVALSGPGLRALLGRDIWQQRTDPFFLSIMAIGETLKDRQKEIAEIACILETAKIDFNERVGIQLNVSCPNVNISHSELSEEITRSLDYLQYISWPVIVKVNALTPIPVMIEAQKHPAFYGVCVSNTIPWGAIPERIPWSDLFGSEVSPLKKRGYSAGGLSGEPLLRLTQDWVWNARRLGFKKHINAGGGILKAEDVDVLFDMGADSVFVGSIVYHKPYNLRGIIKRAHDRWREKNKIVDIIERKSVGAR
jgi:dihydroorotate dehydrogenase